MRKQYDRDIRPPKTRPFAADGPSSVPTVASIHEAEQNEAEHNAKHHDYKSAIRRHRAVIGDQAAHLKYGRSEHIRHGRAFGRLVAREAFGEPDKTEMEDGGEFGIPVPATMTMPGIGFLSCAVPIAELPTLSGFVADRNPAMNRQI